MCKLSAVLWTSGWWLDVIPTTHETCVVEFLCVLHVCLTTALSAFISSDHQSGKSKIVVFLSFVFEIDLFWMIL